MYVPWVEQGQQKIILQVGGEGRETRVSKVSFGGGGGVRFMRILGCLETCCPHFYSLADIDLRPF